MADEVTLTEEQIEKIKDIRRKYKDCESVLRKCDIVLMLSLGFSASNIGTGLNRTMQYVYYIKHLFLRYGIHMLYSSDGPLSDPNEKTQEKVFNIRTLDTPTISKLKEMYDDPNTLVSIRKRIYVILKTNDGVSNSIIASKLYSSEDFVKEVQKQFELFGIDIFVSK